MDVPVSNEIDNEPREPDVKRAKLRLLLKNGHDCIFADWELPKHLQVECPICLCVLHDPHMIDCKCGASFCQPCIQPTRSENRPCPLCNNPFSLSMSNPSVQRAINSLQVYCSFKEAGCEWVGELGALSEHLNDRVESDNYKSTGCTYLQLKCCYCDEKLQRRYVLEHETTKCSKRPYKCDTCNEFESTFEDVTTKHVNVCPCGLAPCPNDCGVWLQRKNVNDHLATNCPLEIVTCSFNYAGCEEKLPRKDVVSHITDNWVFHMILQTISNQNELNALRAQVQIDVKGLGSKGAEVSHLRILPVDIVMDGYDTKMREKRNWSSEPFYTRSQGYKMNLSIKADGSHLSVYIHMMRGEFDDRLEWPYQGTILIQLFDQNDAKKCFMHTKMLSFSSAPEASACRVNEGTHNSVGWGYTKFITHAELIKHNMIKNDSLCFRISCASTLQQFLQNKQ